MVTSQNQHNPNPSGDVKNLPYIAEDDTTDNDATSVSIPTSDAATANTSTPADTVNTTADISTAADTGDTDTYEAGSSADTTVAATAGNAHTSAQRTSTAASADTDAAEATAASASATDKNVVNTADGPGDGAPAAFTSTQRWLLACLSIGSVLDGFCQAIQLPFFPGEAQRRGLSLAASGAVFSAFALTEMLAYPAMGWLAPRLGVRRLYLAGLVTAGVATLAFGLLTYVSGPDAFLAGCVAVRAAEAVGTAATLTGVRTIVINQFPGRVNTAIGVIESVKAAGLCVGPALGGGLYALGGYGLPFYTLGGMLLASAATSLVAMPAMQEAESEETDTEVEDVKRASRHSYLQMVALVACCPDNWLIFTILYVVSMSWWALDPSLGPYVHQELDVGPAELGLFYVASLSAFAVASPVWSRVADSVRNTYLLVAGCLAPAALGILLLPPAPPLGLRPSRLLLGIGMVVRETFNIGAYLPLLALLLRCSVAHGMREDVHGQALVAAAFGAVYNVGKVAWPLVGAAVIQAIGLPLLASCMAGVTLAMAVVVAIRGMVYRHQLKQQQQQQHQEQQTPAEKMNE